MEVGIHANMVDRKTAHVADALHPTLEKLSRGLGGEYGGVMEHLWIDLELIESYARRDGGPLHRFRFAKRVSGRSPHGLPPLPDSFNVAHYSVRPDFEHIASLSGHRIGEYALALIYASTEVLVAKQKRLGGFNAQLFQERFLKVCEELGVPIPTTPR